MATPIRHDAAAHHFTKTVLVGTDYLSAGKQTVQRWKLNAAPLMVIFKKNKLRLFYNHFLPPYYIYTGWKVF